MKMRTHKVLVAALLAIAVSNGGCTRDTAWSGVLSAINAQYPDVRHVTTDSLESWMADDSAPQPILLDARTTEEYEVSHLKGAVRVDPDADDLSALDSLSRDTPIVAYCSVGYRSSALATRLEEAGFTNVANLEGSIFRWANEGRPVYRERQPVEQVHPYNAAWGRLLRKDLRSE